MSADLRCQQCAAGEHDLCARSVFIRTEAEPDRLQRFPCQCPGTYVTGVRVRNGDLYLSTRGRVREHTENWMKRVTLCGLALSELPEPKPKNAPKPAPVTKGSGLDVLQAAIRKRAGR